MIDLSFFFFNDTATTEIYTLSLHDALPISILGHYQRLGFVTEADRGVYWYMRRAPQPARMPGLEDFTGLVGTDFALQLPGAAPVALRLEKATVTQGLLASRCSLRFKIGRAHV